MLTFDELLNEIKRRSPAEQLVLMEELARTLRARLRMENKPQPDPQNFSKTQASESAKTPEELGWPPGYFENVYGSLRDTNFERPSQGEYETREDLD